MVVMGTTALYRGRQWQARTLLTGARQLAEEAGLHDTALRVMITLPSFVALDDPRTSLALGKEALALARRLGRRRTSSPSCSTPPRTRAGRAIGTGRSGRSRARCRRSSRSSESTPHRLGGSSEVFVAIFRGEARR